MRAKLSSSSGITIVLAMSIFLLVTIFSVTMLTGALNAAFSSEWQRRQEAQSYLTATSAAMILERLLSEPDAEALGDYYGAHGNLKAYIEWASYTYSGTDSNGAADAIKNNDGFRVELTSNGTEYQSGEIYSVHYHIDADIMHSDGVYCFQYAPSTPPPTVIIGSGGSGLLYALCDMLYEIDHADPAVNRTSRNFSVAVPDASQKIQTVTGTLSVESTNTQSCKVTVNLMVPGENAAYPAYRLILTFALVSERQPLEYPSVTIFFENSDGDSDFISAHYVDYCWKTTSVQHIDADAESP